MQSLTCPSSIRRTKPSFPPVTIHSCLATICVFCRERGLSRSATGELDFCSCGRGRAPSLLNLRFYQAKPSFPTPGSPLPVPRSLLVILSAAKDLVGRMGKILHFVQNDKIQRTLPPGTIHGCPAAICVFRRELACLFLNAHPAIVSRLRQASTLQPQPNKTHNPAISRSRFPVPRSLLVILSAAKDLVGRMGKILHFVQNDKTQRSHLLPRAR